MSYQENDEVPAASLLNDRYSQLELLGEGSFGIVVKARDVRTGRFVALKKIRDEQMSDGVPATVLREIACLKELRHPSIVDLLDILYVNEKLYLVFECLENDLKQYMDAAGALTPVLIQVISFLKQLLVGVHVCHSRGVVHRDIKPQNLLIGKEHNLKLADFGLCRAFTLPMRALDSRVATSGYRAPELLLGMTRYSAAVDIWSTGCVFAEMATNKRLFPGDSEIAQLYKIFHICGTPSEAMWPGVTYLPEFDFRFPPWSGVGLEAAVSNLSNLGMDLLKKMLVYDPNKRITANEALEHPYFRESYGKTSNSVTNIV